MLEYFLMIDGILALIYKYILSLSNIKPHLESIDIHNYYVLL